MLAASLQMKRPASLKTSPGSLDDRRARAVSLSIIAIKERESQTDDKKETPGSVVTFQLAKTKKETPGPVVRLAPNKAERVRSHAARRGATYARLRPVRSCHVKYYHEQAVMPWLILRGVAWLVFGCIDTNIK